MWKALKILGAHPKALINTLLTRKYSLLLCPQNNQHLNDKKAWSVHIYCIGITSFKFSNCVEKNNAKLTFLQRLKVG